MTAGSRPSPELRRRMENAAHLPAEHTERQVLEERLADDPAARAYWESLVAEDEVLRRQLPAVQVPVGLEERLLRAAETTPSSRQRSWMRFVIVRLAIAAAVIIIVVNSVHLGTPTTPRYTPLTLAELAVANEVDDHHHHHAVVTDAPERLAEELSKQLPFPVSFPPLSTRLTLEGGRKCTLGELPVAYSKWKGPEGRYALFQFVAADAGFPESAERRVVRVDSVPGQPEPCQTCVWTHEGEGFVFVAWADEDFLDWLPWPGAKRPAHEKEWDRR